MTVQRPSTPSAQHTGARRAARMAASRPFAVGALLAAGLFLVTGCAGEGAAPDAAATSTASPAPSTSPTATPSSEPAATPAPSPAATPEPTPEPEPPPAAAPTPAAQPVAAPPPATAPAPTAAPPVPAPQPVAVAPAVPATQVSASPATGGAQALFASLNSARASAGLPPLAYSSALEASATTWSASMAATGIMEHNPGVEGQIPGGWTAWGENVAYAGGHPDNAATIHTSWMNSPGHRANILRSSFTQVGIGYVVDAAGTAWATQVFAGY